MPTSDAVSGVDETQLRFGEPGAPVVPDQSVGGTFGVWDLVRMVVVLLLVVAAVYGLVALLRRRVEDDSSAEGGPIRVLASQTISAGKAIHAVRVGARVYLIGTGENSVNLIAGIRDQETIDELELAHGNAAASRKRTSFGALLGSWLSNAAASAVTGGPTREAPVDELKRQRERLRGMRRDA